MPAYHAMGFLGNGLFNLASGVFVALLARPASTPVTPHLYADAAAALRPTVVETVPWVLVALLGAVDADPAADWVAPLRDLRAVMVGGGLLPRAVGDALEAHGVQMLT